MNDGQPNPAQVALLDRIAKVLSVGSTPAIGRHYIAFIGELQPEMYLVGLHNGDLKWVPRAAVDLPPPPPAGHGALTATARAKGAADDDPEDKPRGAARRANRRAARDRNKHQRGLGRGKGKADRLAARV